MREAKRGGSESKFSYSQTKFLVVIAVLMGLIIADISLIRIYDFVSKLFIPMQARLVLLSAISLACLASAFILLELIKPRTSQERKNRLHVEIIYRITKLIQYALGAVIIYMILQMFLTSSYATSNLLILISSSYLLSIGILGIFIARMLSLVSFNRNMIVLVLFVIAIGSITANIVITLINVSFRLEERPSETRMQFGGSMDISKGRFNTLDNLYFYSYLISFITAWAATASLLRYYSGKFGKLKYWLISTLPMVFFLAQFVPSYTTLLFSSIRPDPFFMAAWVTLIATVSKPLAGLMLALGFWTMARVAERTSTVRKYLVFAGFGFFLLFSSNQAILMALAPYPPFGIVTITIIGISAYLVVSGLYTSTVSLSQNTEIRRSIRRLARSQSALFDSMVSAESEKEIEKRVMEIVRKESVEMANRSGVEISLSDSEAKEYLEEVIKEIKKQ